MKKTNSSRSFALTASLALAAGGAVVSRSLRTMLRRPSGRRSI